MITKILTGSDGIIKAAAALRKGEIVGIPTETVYGLGARFDDEEAIKSIYIAKERPADNPLISHISCLDMLSKLIVFDEIYEASLLLIENFWPGPLTIIFNKNSNVPDIVSGGMQTVAVRFPSHPDAREIISLAGVPIAAPSANLSGSPSPTNYLHVYRDLSGRIPFIYKSSDAEIGLESTVVKVEKDKIIILRPGFISHEDISGITDLPVVMATTQSMDAKPLSPGMKYKHYAPIAKVFLYSNLKEVQCYAEEVSEKGASNFTNALIICCGEEFGKVLGHAENLKEYYNIRISKVLSYRDLDDYAQNLYKWLRMADDIGVDVVFARKPNENGLGSALMDRLKKASHNSDSY